MELSINKTEVLRYLGYKGGDYDENIDMLLNACIFKLQSAWNKTMRPKTLLQRFPLLWGETLSLENTGFALLGQDIRNHLAGCESAALLAVTLGSDADRLIRTAQVTDMTKAVILDACATAAIEQVCDTAEKELGRQMKAEGKFITWRFSPGYGDMPIECQQELIRLLDAPRKIGLSATQNNILTPKKSVTAVIGISPTPVLGERKSCEICLMREKCQLRKSGGHCGKE